MPVCISAVRTFCFANQSGEEGRFVSEPSTPCDWVRDSASAKLVESDEASAEDVRLALEYTGVGDYVAAGTIEGIFMAVTDCAGSRPLFVGGSKRGSVKVSNRVSQVCRMNKLEVVPGDTCLVVEQKGIMYLKTRKIVEGGHVKALSVAQRLEESIRNRIDGKCKVGVAFSGGLDSSLIAHLAAKISKKGNAVKLFTVVAPGYGDRETAKRAADILGNELVEVSADEQTCLEIIRDSNSRCLWSTPMDASLAVGFTLASKEASSAGCEILLAGQGADELFGGYKKYESASADRELVRKLMKYDRDHLYTGLARDAEAIREGGCEPSFPYLDRLVVNAAMSIPADKLFLGGVRKAPLREAARELGLPDEIAHVPKKAFQYSSGLQKMLEKTISHLLPRG